MATVSCKNHRFEHIGAVIFDKDGTLAKVESYLIGLGEARAQAVDLVVPGVRADILAALGQAAGYIDPAGMMAVGSRAENEIAAAAFVAAKGIGWIAALKIVKEAFEQAAESLPNKVEQTPPLKGAIALIDRLNTCGITTGIVSSDTHSEVEAFVQHYGVNVNWYCGAGGAALSKTQTGFLEFACSKLGVAPSKTLVIGDSASDRVLSNQGAAGFVGMVGGWSVSPLFENSIATITHLSEVQTSTE